ncbi:hypothetical protein ACTI_67040 [Actinoplanes sp. OR16]|nr:hypothetical protein ACTI_67040 [Actinoplanes sp. OR16]
MSTAEPAAFYERLSENEFRTTAATASPWDESLQHGGPPAALLARAAMNARPDDGVQIGRIGVDMLGGIPQGVIRSEATVVRPGRRIELIEAKLWANGRLAVTALIWRIRVDHGVTAAQTAPETVPALPPEQPQRYFTQAGPAWGYGRAVEWRFLTGDYNSLGPADVWTRLRIPLVAGEKTTPIERLMVLADSVNGLSLELPIAQWLSIPPTVNVTVLRPPAHDWMLLRTRTVIGAGGVGLARGQIYDEDGLLAEVAQPLLVQPR